MEDLFNYYNEINKELNDLYTSIIQALDNVYLYDDTRYIISAVDIENKLIDLSSVYNESNKRDYKTIPLEKLLKLPIVGKKDA